MTRQILGWVAGLLFYASAGLLAADPESVWEVKSLTPEGEFEYNPETGVVQGSGGVWIRHQGAELTAQAVTLNQKTGQASARGLVTLQRDGNLWQGDALDYNFQTRVIEAETFKTGTPPFFIEGQGLSAYADAEVYGSYRSTITTDDRADPAYRVKAKTLLIIPGEKFVATGATVYVGDVPVFYWPKYVRHLNRHPNNWVLEPGFRSFYGPYLLSTYNYTVNESLSGAVHLDYRQKRGVGLGPDFQYDLGRWGEGVAKYYYTQDQDPNVNPLASTTDENRQRLYLTHQAVLRDGLTARGAVRWQSDPFIIRDFFEDEYRRNIQPTTFFELSQLWRNYSLNVLTQPQVNDFYERVERLPDIKLTALRQQIGDSPLYYEGDSSVGYFRHNFANNVRPSFEAFRGDSYHQVVLPRTFFGWLNMTPRVGGRFTHYSEAVGSTTALNAEDRWVFNTGVELGFKASRLFEGAESRFWDVDGLRHVVQPTANYVFVPSPNVLPPQLPQFDTLLPSYHLVPIDYPDFNSIDSIDGQNAIRWGLRNHLQTKRQGRIVELVDWQLFTDWRLNPRLGQQTFADLFSDLEFRPREWFWVNSDLRWSINDGVFRRSNHSVVFEPSNRWSLALGHNYFREDPLQGPNSDNNLISGVFYFRLNENWGLRTAHYFEARDGVLEEQNYGFYRDLRSWTSALTFRVRQNRSGPNDFTVAVTFSLKAFPRFGMGADSVSGRDPSAY